MSYNPSIPQASNLLSNSQAQFLTNFGQINSQFGGTSPSTGGDHDGFNNGSGNGSGAHNQVTFLADQSAPSLTRNSTSCVSGLYTNTASAISCLFFQNATQNLQLTGPTSISTSGSVVIQGGLILKWGKISFSSGSSTVTYGAAFPNNFFSLTMNSDSTTPSVNGILSYVLASGTGLTGFTAYQNGSGSLTAYYLALGN